VLRLVFLHELADFHEDFHIGCFFSFFFFAFKVNMFAYKVHPAKLQ
jgi:hypothetical protein